MAPYLKNNIDVHVRKVRILKPVPKKIVRKGKKPLPQMRPKTLPI